MTGPPGESRGVAEIVFPPQRGDMALLRLTSPVPFINNTIGPVCLAASGSVFSHGTPSWVLGWGNVREGGEHDITRHFNWCENGTLVTIK